MRKAGYLLLLILLTAACAVPLARINQGRDTGQIDLDVEPTNAKVFLDGVYVGQASSFTAAAGGMKVVLGRHLLRFEAEGFMPETVEVIGGEEQPPIKVRLLEKPRD